MQHLLDEDKIVQCPFNKNHTLPKSRLQRHIVKCEKNYEPNYKVICPYNATHRLSRSEIAEHIKTCPTKNVVEASHIERTITLDSARWKNEGNSSFTSTFEDDWEGQMGVSGNTSRFSYMNQSDESELDDRESFVGSVGLGRGRLIARRENFVGKLNYPEGYYKY
ncbi:PREDICTED: uncharacterized protein LOC106747583 [Dinoponera quadriceps]|uniref:Uncharacterized protein LOC106747583 n=1 Tax=Dinoponera quadriceps TaxID=609295 RepID=A0A6P3XQQ5_DINQU|nr:PREDICTED: uncharacterized protein LOC106747583 [Dinoponera quadriceps]